MLNREEYNMTFGHNLTQEEFDKILPIVLDPKNIKDMESLSLVDKETYEVTTFYRVIKCGQCKHWEEVDCVEGTCFGECHREPRIIARHVFNSDSWFCADGEPKEGADADN